MKICRLCRKFIWPGQESETQYAQSASGSTGATIHVHTACLKPPPVSRADEPIREG